MIVSATTPKLPISSATMSSVDQQDPQQRIAELERQLAEQQRINELQQKLADAKSAGSSGGTTELGQADIERLRAAFSQAASQAGITPDQLDQALKHANVTVRTSRSVITPGQRNSVGFGPTPAGVWSVPSRARRRSAGILSALAAILFISFGLGIISTLAVPQTTSWTSAIVCGSPGQLSYTKQYADRQGSSVDFRCADGRTVNVYALAGLQSLATMPVAAAAVAAWRFMRRSH